MAKETKVVGEMFPEITYRKVKSVFLHTATNAIPGIVGADRTINATKHPGVILEDHGDKLLLKKGKKECFIPMTNVVSGEYHTD